MKTVSDKMVDKLNAFRKEIEMVKKSDRALIINTCGYVEFLANLIIDATCKLGKKK